MCDVCLCGLKIERSYVDGMCRKRRDVVFVLDKMFVWGWYKEIWLRWCFEIGLWVFVICDRFWIITLLKIFWFLRFDENVLFRPLPPPFYGFFFVYSLLNISLWVIFNVKYFFFCFFFFLFFWYSSFDIHVDRLNSDKMFDIIDITLVIFLFLLWIAYFVNILIIFVCENIWLLFVRCEWERLGNE